MVKYTKPWQRPAAKARTRSAIAKLRGGRSAEEYRRYLDKNRAPLTPSQRELNSYDYFASDDDRLAIEEIENDPSWAAKDAAFKRANPEYWDKDGNRVFQPGSSGYKYQQQQLAKKQAAQRAIAAKIKPPVQKAPPPPQYNPNLPAMLAPPPGQRHLLFGAQLPQQNTVQNNYLNTAFGAGYAPQQPAHPHGTLAPNQIPSNTIQMPSNLARYYALQNGAPRTPFGNLLRGREGEVNRILGTNQAYQNPQATYAQRKPGFVTPYQRAYYGGQNPNTVKK